MAASRAEASKRVRERVADYLLAQRDLSKYPQEGFDTVLGKDDLIPAFVRRWQALSGRRREGRRPDLPPLARVRGA